MLIYESDQSIFLELYSDSLNYIVDYFFKYFEWLKELIEDVTSKRFPSFDSSKNLKHLQPFYRAAYGIEHKLKKNYLLNAYKKNELLLCDDKQLSKPIYKSLNDILFIVISSKTAYIFYKDDSSLKIYNRIKINESLYKTELIIREAIDKQNLKEVLTNEYLAETRFIIIDLYINNSIKGKVSILANNSLINIDTKDYTKLFLKNNYKFDDFQCNTLLGTYRVVIEESEIKLQSS